MSELRSRELGRALRRGAAGRCPNCGNSPLFDGFLTLRETCRHCGLNLQRHGPAAGPAFLSVAIAGVLLVPLMGFILAIFGPDPVILLLTCLAVMPLLAVLLLRVIKGAMVGYLWAFDITSPPAGPE